MLIDLVNFDKKGDFWINKDVICLKIGFIYDLKIYLEALKCR